MPSTNKPYPTVEATTVSLLSLTWRTTLTHTRHLPLAAAAAIWHGGYDLTADPATLLGGAGCDLTAVLTDHQEGDGILGEPEVEIIGTDDAPSATLPELVDAGRQELHTDAGTGQHSAAAQAQAAVLAGPHRQGITDRCATNRQNPTGGATVTPGRQVPA